MCIVCCTDELSSKIVLLVRELNVLLNYFFFKKLPHFEKACGLDILEYTGRLER